MSLKKYVFDEFDTLIGLGTRWLLNSVLFTAFPWLAALATPLYFTLSKVIIYGLEKAGLKMVLVDALSQDKKHMKELRAVVIRAKDAKFKDLSPEEIKELDDAFKAAFDKFVRR